MKKILFVMAVIFYASQSNADGHGGWGHERHHGWGGHHGHHREHYYQQPQIIYYPQPQVVYYAPPPVRYYAQPQVQYYPPQYLSQGYQDPRNAQGLVGGVVGSALGYQMGNGDPIATGLGAVAGAYLGNGMAGRW